MVPQGLDNYAIAARLGISEKTFAQPCMSHFQQARNY